MLFYSICETLLSYLPADQYHRKVLLGVVFIAQNFSGKGISFSFNPIIPGKRSIDPFVVPRSILFFCRVTIADSGVIVSLLNAQMFVLLYANIVLLFMFREMP